MIPSQTFCVLPWMHVACNSSGNLRLCCNSTPGKNIILDEAGAPFKLSKSIDDFNKVYNSQWIKSIRKSMLSGEEVSICQRCYKEEAVGLRSARQSWNEKYTEKIKQELLQTHIDGHADFKPLYFDLRLGNLCNLKCRMCNPYASKKWLDDWNQLSVLEKISSEEKERLSRMDWHEEEEFVSNFVKAIGSVEEIYFTGGEPFLIKRHFEVLEKIVSMGRAQEVSIKYNTNLTYLPPKVFDLWKNFKKVTLNISVDGIGIVNEYIRHPSIWEVLAKNLRAVDEYAGVQKNVVCSIHATLQVYNVEHLVALLNFNKSFTTFSKFPYINILNHPQYLNIQNTPQALKQEIAEEWACWISTNIQQDEQDTNALKIKGLIDYLLAQNDFFHEQFHQYTTDLDSLRGENFADICPRLHRALTSVGPTKIASSQNLL